MYFHAGSGIASSSAYLPENSVSTQQLFRPAAGMIGRNDRYIAKVTGVQEVPVADPALQPSDLAIPAIEQALSESGFSLKSIGAVIFAGMCRDVEEPDTAMIIAKKLGISPPICFDSPNACHGFATALMLADGMIRLGSAQRILICSAEQGFKRAAQADREFEDGRASPTNLASLHPNYTLGDSGAAMIVTRPHESRLMLVDYRLSTDPTLADDCVIKDSNTAAQMDGPKLKRRTMEIVRDDFESMLKQHACLPEDIEHYIVHQTGKVTIREYEQFLGVKSGKVINTIESCGNLVSCTLPIGLSKILYILSPGQRVVFSIQGSGLTSSAWMAQAIK